MSGVELTHSQAKNRLLDIQEEVERLRSKGEAGPLTPEDEVRFADLVAEFDQVDEHRKSLERAADAERVKTAREQLQVGTRESVRDRARGAVERGYVERIGEFDRDAILEPDSIEAARFRNPWDLSEVRTFGRGQDEVAAEMRARALSAIEKMPNSNDKVRSAATGILETWDDRDATLAKMVLVTSSPEYLRAWSKVITGRDKGLTQEERQILDRAMSLTDASGGYLVPFQLDPTVIITSAGTYSGIRQVARQVVATADVWNGVSAAEATWSWDAEGEQASDDTPAFAGPAIPNYKGDGFIPASIESLQDMANASSEIARVLAAGKNTLEATAFSTGSGSGQPTGIVTALVASSPSVIVTSTTTDTFAVADIFKVEGALPERHQGNASWLANRKTYNLVRQFDTAGGAALWTTVGNGLPPELDGASVYRSEAMDGVINASAENYMLIFGDFQNFVITDRIGFSIEPIPHLFGANGRPTGSRGIYAYYRTGSDSVDDGSFRILNVT
jgi:HK97 family phage major capsid protein